MDLLIALTHLRAKLGVTKGHSDYKMLSGLQLFYKTKYSIFITLCGDADVLYILPLALAMKHYWSANRKRRGLSCVES